MILDTVTSPLSRKYHIHWPFYSFFTHVHCICWPQNRLHFRLNLKENGCAHSIFFYWIALSDPFVIVTRTFFVPVRFEYKVSFWMEKLAQVMLALGKSTDAGIGWYKCWVIDSGASWKEKKKNNGDSYLTFIVLLYITRECRLWQHCSTSIVQHRQRFFAAKWAQVIKFY